MRFSIVLITALFAVAANAATVKDLLNDAELSRAGADYFKAYRSYSYIESEKQKYFAELGLQGYLETVFVLFSEDGATRECSRLSKDLDVAVTPKISYLCGLQLLERGKPERARQFLKAIGRTSGFYWPSQILMCSADLLDSNFVGALDHLKTEDLKSYQKYDLENQFFFCRARALVGQNKFEESIKNYQAVQSRYSFFGDSLMETAWVFFKQRSTESASVLLDVIIGNYEGDRRRFTDLKITPSTYYKTRYLKAYLQLVEQRSEGAANEFADLKVDYDKFLSRIKPKMDPLIYLKLVSEKAGSWDDVRNLPTNLNSYLSLMGEWLSPSQQVKTKAEILLQMALLRELKRIRDQASLVTPVAANYSTQVATMQQKTWTQFGQEFLGLAAKLQKSLETLRVKSDLGRLEIVWMNRTQGARTLDEILDNYSIELKGIDDYIER